MGYGQSTGLHNPFSTEEQQERFEEHLTPQPISVFSESEPDSDFGEDSGCILVIAILVWLVLCPHEIHERHYCMSYSRKD